MAPPRRSGGQRGERAVDLSVHRPRAWSSTFFGHRAARGCSRGWPSARRAGEIPREHAAGAASCAEPACPDEVAWPCPERPEERVPSPRASVGGEEVEALWVNLGGKKQFGRVETCDEAALQRARRAASRRAAPLPTLRRRPYFPRNGYRQSVGGVNVSLIDRGDTQRMRLPGAPALSLVPLARLPPKGCWPTTAPVGLSLM